MILSPLIEAILVILRSRPSVVKHKAKEESKVENEHTNGTTEAPNVSTTDTLAKEDTMMIIPVDTDITVLAVVHLLGDVNVAFYTV